MTRRMQWLLIAALVSGALAIAATGERGPATVEERAASLAAEVRCPTCQGQAVADSEAPASRAIRDDIRRRIDAGQSDREIRAYLVSRYGKEILLKPEGSGVAAAVWALPVVALVFAAAGLAAALRRWRGQGVPEPTDEDLVLVERVRRGG